jgi:hypothetical protein
MAGLVSFKSTLSFSASKFVYLSGVACWAAFWAATCFAFCLVAAFQFGI